MRRVGPQVLLGWGYQPPHSPTARMRPVSRSAALRQFSRAACAATASCWRFAPSLPTAGPPRRCALRRLQPRGRRIERLSLGHPLQAGWIWRVAILARCCTWNLGPFECWTLWRRRLAQRGSQGRALEVGGSSLRLHAGDDGALAREYRAGAAAYHASQIRNTARPAARGPRSSAEHLCGTPFHASTLRLSPPAAVFRSRLQARAYRVFRKRSSSTS